MDGASDRQLNVEPYWLPFTANRHFKANPNPRILVSAKGAYYRNAEGNSLFDCLSGLWCSPLGHGRAAIADAVKEGVATLDYATALQMSNPVTLRLAERITQMAPDGLDHVFFVNSGSEGVDTALKIAAGYHKIRGQGGRFRMVGRQRGYHGVGIGGISVGGIPANRKMFASMMMPGTDHLPHTYNLKEMAFSKGQPTWGAHLADELERIVALHDASTIAAVILEPMQGSTGVVVPPVGYLERIREICTRHGILLIFDEVITGFGRLGTAFGADRLNVVPDMIVFAKAITNGVIPMGGVLVTAEIYNTFMTGPAHVIEFFHGYTYSGHPVAAAAAHAVLDIMEGEGSFAQSAKLEPVLEAAVHTLDSEPGVLDVRNFGLAAAVDLQPIEGQPGLRAMQVFEAGLDRGFLFRPTGDTISMAPPFIATPAEIVGMAAGLRELVQATG